MKTNPGELPEPKVCPKCAGTVFTGCQYQGTREDYDGISEWICDNCGARFGRWTRRELLPGDLEHRYGI